MSPLVRLLPDPEKFTPSTADVDARLTSALQQSPDCNTVKTLRNLDELNVIP
jgi:hypothetical protein